MQLERIEIHEDNSGAIYLTGGGETWSLGPVTPDMYGRAGGDAQGWADGDWEPNEHDGQRRASLTDLDHIATWTRAGLTIEKDYKDDPVAGAGGELYLGIEGP